MSEIATPGRLNDLGNLLLAFVMLWAYMSFCQFLIIWSGNLTEEIPWYLRRTRGGWEWVAAGLDRLPVLLAVLRAARFAKTSGIPVRSCACRLLILFMHWVDLVWLVIPASSPTRPARRFPGSRFA